MKIKKSQLKKIIESYLYEQEDEVPPGAEDEADGAPPGTEDTGEEDEVPPDSENDESPPEEEEEEKFDDIEDEEISFKNGEKVSVSFRDLGNDETKFSIKDTEGNNITSEPKYGSALLVTLFGKAKKNKDEKLKKSVMHFIKKYHTDLDNDSNDLQVLEWIKTKQVRFTKFWIDEINSILKNRKNKKSIS